MFGPLKTISDADTSEHTTWLKSEASRLARFGAGSLAPSGGAHWLDSDGAPINSRAIESWISARMAYVFGLAALDGEIEAREWARLGLAGFQPGGVLMDADHGGWLDVAGMKEADKSAYTHAFVLLAAASGSVAQVESADALLVAAIDVLDGHFWDERQGLARDSVIADWATVRDYRGLNANMHLVEAYLATGDLGRPALHERALRVCARVIAWGRDNGWRLPEHFKEDWSPVLSYNSTRRADPFKPYGSTPGHGFEWARLLACASLLAGITSSDARILRAAARHLYERAAADSWARSQRPGFLYTVDWNGSPVVDTQLHWVAAEAVSAASTLGMVDGDELRIAEAVRWWTHIRDVFVDESRGSWVHELDAESRPSTTIWAGKPDIYHAYQACIIPTREPAPSVLRALKERDL